MLVEIIPALLIHISQKILESPKAEAEWQDFCLSPVDYPGEVPAPGVDEDVHLEEVAVCKDRWQAFEDWIEAAYEIEDGL